MKTTYGLLILSVSMMGLRSAACQPRDGFTEQVRAAEIAFAQTMADRDFDAFMSHIAYEAVFVSSEGALRGVGAIGAGWSRFFDDDVAPFSWMPDLVEVLDSGDLALSSGPVLDPEGQRIGTFNSIWRRGEGGWKVVFDKGCPPCDCEKPD
jgi:ketosteroid isomerase-like protein